MRKFFQIHLKLLYSSWISSCGSYQDANRYSCQKFSIIPPGISRRISHGIPAGIPPFRSSAQDISQSTFAFFPRFFLEHFLGTL